MKALPREMISAIVRMEKAHIENGQLAPLNPRVVRDVGHMAAKVRALSYRMPLFVRVGNRGFTYSISGWCGAA